MAQQLAAAGINTLTVDSRGHGESGGKYDNWTAPNRAQGRQQAQADIGTAFQFLASQAGVKGNVIGVGGAGLLGVDNSVQTARQHTAQVKSLVLISGETFRPGIEFLHQTPQLPELFVVSDNDEYPPTAEAMQLLYVSASSPGKKLVHTLRRKMRRGFGTSPGMLAGFRLAAITEPTCLRTRTKPLARRTLPRG